MTDQFPPPPVPADCDLTGFHFMPLDCIRLVQSDLAAIASGDEFKAAVILWCKSWSNIPAGSWTDDDRVLAHAAGLAPKAWTRVRAMALHGWYKASDGRLYHPVVSEKAAEAWAHRQRQRDRARKGNAVRWGSPDDRQTIAEGSPARSLNDRKGQGQGQGQGQCDVPSPSAPEPREATSPPRPVDPIPGDLPTCPPAREVRRYTVGDLAASHGTLLCHRSEDRDQAATLLALYGWDAVSATIRRLEPEAKSRPPGKQRVLLSELTAALERAYELEGEDYRRAGLPVPAHLAKETAHATP